jgi:hypothetical protein
MISRLSDIVDFGRKHESHPTGLPVGLLIRYRGTCAIFILVEGVQRTQCYVPNVSVRLSRIMMASKPS